jgi:hypothetical protein
MLNAEGVTSPGDAAWTVVSGVNGILTNELYDGTMV